MVINYIESQPKKLNSKIINKFGCEIIGRKYWKRVDNSPSCLELLFILLAVDAGENLVLRQEYYHWTDRFDMRFQSKKLVVTLIYRS